MAFIVADRVKETSTTTGTGSLTLAGAVTGFQTFDAPLATNDTTYYAIEGVDGNGIPSGEWEVGLGTFTSPATLARTTVLASSNSGAAVNLSAGTKNVFIGLPAGRQNYFFDTATVYSNDAGAAAGPVLTLYRDSASPAANDVIGRLQFDGEDSAGNQQTYAYIETVLLDATSTTEDAYFSFYVVNAGSLINFATLSYNAFSITTGGALTCGTIELGHASDTTLSRSAAGVLAVEGTPVMMTGKHTIAMPALAWFPPSTGFPTYTTAGNVPVWRFDGATANYIRAVIPMPKAWNESTVTFKAFGVLQSGGAAGETAVFQVAAKACSNDDVAWSTTVLSTGAQTVTMEWTANSDLLVSTESSALTIDGTPAEGDIVLFEFSRQPGNASDDSTDSWDVYAVHIYISYSAGNDA